MNAQELYDEWTEGESNGMRPKRVQSIRDDLAEATGMSIPHSASEIEGWLEVMTQSGTLTRKLRDAASDADDQQFDVQIVEPSVEEREAIIEKADYQDLRAIAGTVDSVPGAGITASEMRKQLRDVLGDRKLASRLSNSEEGKSSEPSDRDR